MQAILTDTSPDSLKRRYRITMNYDELRWITMNYDELRVVRCVLAIALALHIRWWGSKIDLQSYMFLHRKPSHWMNLNDGYIL